MSASSTYSSVTVLNVQIIYRHPFLAFPPYFRLIDISVTFHISLLFFGKLYVKGEEV